MARTLKMAIEDGLGSTDQPGLTLRVEETNLTDWCLHLVMLERDMIDNVVLVDANDQPRIVLSLDRPIPDSDRGRVHWEGKLVKVALAPNELDLWLHHCLTAYRDSGAETNHIDTEIRGDRAKGRRGLYLTLEIPASIKWVSVEERRRLLGL